MCSVIQQPLLMLERFYSVLRLFCESFGTDFMQALQSILRFHLLAVIAFSASATTLQAGEFISHIHKGDSGTSKYSVYLPDGFSRDQSWPVLLWLHGAGERGDDGTLQTSFGLGKILKNRESPFPFVVVFPQSQDRHAPILSGWDVQTADGGTALKILDEAIQEYGLDSGRQVLSGWSMGGFGAIELATHSPERWKSVVVLAGGPPKQTLTTQSRFRSGSFMVKTMPLFRQNKLIN